jgi:hypothetical protein
MEIDGIRKMLEDVAMAPDSEVSVPGAFFVETPGRSSAASHLG